MRVIYIFVVLILSDLSLAKLEKHLKRKTRQPYDKSGTPNLYNCAAEKAARKTPVPPNFELILSAYWTNTAEFKKDSSVLRKYNWAYKVFKERDPEERKIKEPLDTAKFENKFGGYLYLKFPPYTLTPGLYVIYPNISLKNPNDRLKPFPFKDCVLYYEATPPIAVITGGTYRLVPSNTPLVLNGSESMDLNHASKDSTTLKYHWTCSQEHASPNFCAKDPISIQKSFIIPPKYLTPGGKFEVVLKVTSYNKFAEVRQNIEIKSDGVLLEIKCQKNCPPASEWTSINSTTFLSIVCLKNCDDVKEENFVWSLSPKSQQTNFNFDYDKDTQFGNKGGKFVINKSVLKPDEYIVTVNLTNGKGEATTTLIVQEPPEVRVCTPKPASGESLQTHFLVECDQKLSFQPHFYEVYSMQKGEDYITGQVLVDGFYPEVYRKLFLLPPSDSYDFMVKISIENGPYTLVAIHPTVTSTVSQKSSKETIETLKKIYVDVGANLVGSIEPEKREKGLQTLQTLIDELRDIKSDDKEFQEFVQDFKYEVADDLLKVSFVTSREVMKMADAVEKLMTYNNQNESEPLLSKLSSTLCKKLGQKYVDVFQKERFPLIHEEMNRKMARSISRCLEANTNPNFNILEPLPVNITTMRPSAHESLLIENYPDYHDFNDEYYKNMENLQEATSNILEGAAAAAKVIALSTATGEKPVLQKDKNTEILVAKDKGEILTTMKLQTNGVVLVPPKNLGDDEHSIDILMVTWTKNLLWWIPNSTKASSNLVNVEFWHSTCKKRLNTFDSPAEIFLNITHQHLENKKVEDVIHVPKDFFKIHHHKLNRYIYVRRIDLPFRHILLVEFHNLSSTALLNVVITMFKFPTIEDFAPPKVVTASGEKFMVAANPFQYDLWSYIGILPKKESTKSFQFQANFYIASCIRWRPAKNQWKPTCMPGEKSNLTMLHCHCSNFSTIAGYIQHAKTINQEVLQEELILHLRVNLIIFILLSTVVALYCFLLLLTLCKRKKKAGLYFLADNLTKHRYAYVIVVITGKIGTTSHLTVKITGSRGSTPAHVLNYPDPKMRLLQQKSEDVFVITSEKHLGKVQEIELWVDCFGTKPSWFCEEVEIYDLQLKKTWYFGINRLLSAEKGNIYLTLYPTQRKSKNPVTRVFKKITVWSDLHTWCFWAHERNFSFMKRLTVVLSTILMTFVMILLLERVPEMELRDTLDLNQFIFGGYDVFVAVLGSLVPFIIHIILAWSFRLSSLQFPEVADYNKLPYNLTKACWRVLIVFIVTSTSLLIVWGFWLPYNCTLVWLTACCIGIILIIIIYENVVTTIVGLCYKREKIEYFGKNFNTIVELIEKQRFLLGQHFGGSLLQTQIEHLHKPLTGPQFKERKMKDKIRKNYGEELVDLVMFSIYTVILYIVILVNKDSFTVISKNEVENMLEGKHSRTMGFTSIRSVDEVYRYINETLIPVLQPVYWYEGVPISQSGTMVDFTNKYLGVVRFRQQRVMPDVCSVVELMKFLNITKCWPELTSSNTEARNFGYKWGNFSSTLILDRLRSIWHYLGESDTRTLSSLGQLGIYTGGGYLSYLGRTTHNSLVNFRQLVQKLWIDQRTRGFFIEFLTYDSNYNMFNAVKLLFEQSATGYVSNTIQIQPARMIFIENEIEKISIIFFGLFVVWVMVLFFKRSVSLIKNISKFYKNVWFMIDLLIIVMSLICIIIYAIRLKMIHIYLNTLEKVRHNEFVSYFELFYIEDFITVVAAFLVLISTARLWKFLRFGLFFRIMERTLSHGGVPLLSLMFGFFVILMAFGLSGVLIFGNEFPELSSLMKIVATLICLSLKPDQFEITNYTKFTIAYLYFSLYLLLMQIILLICIAIIIMSYIKASLDFSDEPPAYNFRNFFEEQMRQIPKMFRGKYDHLSGGEEKKKVKPKSDEFRYANCLSTEKSTMLSMACVTKCVIRHMSRRKGDTDLSGDDIKLMLEVCQHLLHESHENDETEIFFKGHFAGERIRIIDEKRITKMADVVELLLREHNAFETE